MTEIQITQTVLIVFLVCTTLILGIMLYRMKQSLKIKIDKTGVELELTEKKPETKDIENETDIV
jgi:hypothetical protein